MRPEVARTDHQAGITTLEHRSSDREGGVGRLAKRTQTAMAWREVVPTSEPQQEALAKARQYERLLCPMRICQHLVLTAIRVRHHRRNLALLIAKPGGHVSVRACGRPDNSGPASQEVAEVSAITRCIAFSVLRLGRAGSGRRSLIASNDSLVRALPST
jgi:hypothetical protein